MVTRVDPMPNPASSSSLIPTVREKDVVNVATVNVRYDNGTNSSSSSSSIFSSNSNKYAEKPWSERKSRLIDCLLSTGELDIVGFQEVLHNQLSDIQSLLGDGYGHVGVGRDDGGKAGEYSPIFYNKVKFEVVKWTTIWLSPTPDKPSKGWDAALPRIATLLTLRQRHKNDELLHAVNTHYDHLGLRARAESSLLIRSQIYDWVKKVEEEAKVAKEGPVILFGDFNSPSDEAGYRNITSPHPLPSGQNSFYFLDSFTNLFSGLQTRPYGPAHTYTDFAPPGSRNATRIDFVMLGAVPHTPRRENEGGEGSDEKPKPISRGGWKVDRYACFDNFVEGDVEGWTGRWSDHRAVRVRISR
ncbi:hypothetical protein I302_102151 [Kwoniella bestiolae CBS 10118]|uniref:Endonuclease/exonuclease/phosphatase n=1 Tax=Kwoniella bestiolae CBS 10118 TaxID=1296100 RepID=A0A1B9GE99_9TREE|nr:endonuclease/exonuclease/phosphatase [Kwoniella bestiolae CBS 10118]OCF29338.1 endonuclease/exonuclease/phosphatase [Kwoniella bestiolae CBS 10118]